MSQVTSVPNLVILGWWEVGPKKFRDAYTYYYAYDTDTKLMANSWQGPMGQQEPESSPIEKTLVMVLIAVAVLFCASAVQVNQSTENSFPTLEYLNDTSKVCNSIIIYILDYVILQYVGRALLGSS